MNKIIEYLEELFPNPVCELDFETDYQLLISVMLSAQTTDKRVNEVTKILYSKYNNLNKLSNANVEDVKSIIKPLGSFNKKSENVINISKTLLKMECVPNDREFLESLPGVGRKTANVVLGILYKVPCVAVDTHVERVSKRLGLVEEDDSVLTVEQKLTKLFKNDDMVKRHHQLLLFGRYYCKAKKPDCVNCKIGCKKRLLN